MWGVIPALGSALLHRKIRTLQRWTRGIRPRLPGARMAGHDEFHAGNAGPKPRPMPRTEGRFPQVPGADERRVHPHSRAQDAAEARPGIGVILVRMDLEPKSSSTDGLTGLLNLGLAGDSSANDRAFQMVYAELRRSAQRQMRRGIDAATLSPTGLVSEVFIKLNDGMPRVNDRAHFYSLAARAMRQILLDHQRDKQAAKRGGKVPHVELVGEPLAGEGEDIDYFALDQALESLRQMDPRAAQVVEWHFFSGLNFIEIAELIGISDKTARRDWDSARAFLLMQLSAG